MTESDEKKKPKPPVVYALTRASRCFNCDQRLLPGEIIKLKNAEDDREVLCLSCAGLTGYLVVPSGNAKATRLVAKYCPSHCVVMRWSELWKCYERQGLLADESAVVKVEQELGTVVRLAT